MDSEDEFVYSDQESDNDQHIDEESIPQKRKNFIVLSKDDIRELEEECVENVSSALSISRASATILLLHYKWSVDNVHDAWFADEQKVRQTVGLLENQIRVHPNSDTVTCKICFEDTARRSMHATSCGHLFCESCWKGYIRASVMDGPGCLLLRCAEPSCGAAVGADMITSLASDEEKEKYECYVIRSYVQDKYDCKTKWCPAPGCDYAVDFTGDSDGENYDVCCKCRYSFCWNCSEDAHRPADCGTVAKWNFKNKDESENMTWILANSKPCPNCKRPIQKNEGCMHMTCSAPCSHQFCWLCLASWASHSGACNRFDSGKTKVDSTDHDEKRRKMAKSLLDRYAHYYERWAANKWSKLKAIKDFQQTEGVHIEKLRAKQNQPISQLQFIPDAWLQIIECRRVLQWTYAYGYYLPEDEHAKRQLFEHFQGDAETALERLHHCAEKDLQVHLNAKERCTEFDFNQFRKKLAGLTSVTRNYFENLVQALENGLADVTTHGQDNLESWTCGRSSCMSSNDKYSTVCLRCSTSRSRSRRKDTR